MRMRYVTNEGVSFFADNPHEVIDKLRSSSFNPDATVEIFMARMCERVKIQTGIDVDTDSPEILVQKLIGLGLLKISD